MLCSVSLQLDKCRTKEVAERRWLIGIHLTSAWQWSQTHDRQLTFKTEMIGGSRLLYSRVCTFWKTPTHRTKSGVLEVSGWGGGQLLVRLSFWRGLMGQCENGTSWKTDVGFAGCWRNFPFRLRSLEWSRARSTGLWNKMRSSVRLCAPRDLLLMSCIAVCFPSSDGALKGNLTCTLLAV